MAEDKPHIKSITILLIVASILFISSFCFADLSIEQNCQAITKSKSMLTSWNEATFEYQRRVFIKDDFLAIQLVVNDIVTKEYGFDFQAKLYYESDLINKDYRKFLFSKINEEYAKIKMRNLQSDSRMNMITAMFGNIGPVNYKVKSSRSLFRRKKIGNLSCALYRVTMGHGYSPFETMSWGKDIKAWGTKDIPNYSQYEKVVNQLKKEGGFYLAKSNEISDFIVTLIYAEGYPIETYETIKQDFGMGRAMQNGHTVLYQLDTKPIADNTLSYFRDKDAFILNADEMKSDKTAPQLSMPFFDSVKMAKGKKISPYFFREETPLDKTYTFAIPILFYLGLVYYTYKHITRRTSAPLSNKWVYNFYCLVIFLYLLQIAHLFIPYYKSIGTESSIILILGTVFILGGNYLEMVNSRKQAMNSTYAKVCPHCKAVIDKLCAICPRCNKKVN